MLPRHIARTRRAATLSTRHRRTATHAPQQRARNRNNNRNHHDDRTLLSRYPEALVVPDLTQDVRFTQSPVVRGWPHARFYAACPLVNHNGMRLGTL
jgi:GAF domain-containing protein